jgi:anti-sigma regulatory factor (Ser/Thr protein kinase)
MSAAERITASSIPAFTLRSEVKSRVDVLSFCESVRRSAMGFGLEMRRIGELSLVVAELATNAVIHGSGGMVNVALSTTGWTVSVRDAGPGFSEAVLADAGKSDRLGPDGVRPPADGRRSFGSGLASVRRLSTSLSLRNLEPVGARAVAHRDFTPASPGAER